MPAWVNYHSHTYYCDGAQPPDEYVKEAIRLRLPAYGYSSHAPVNFESDWCIPDQKLNSYLAEIDKIRKDYAQDIQIYLGLEIDYIPGIADRQKHILGKKDLDYFVGSVHFVDTFINGEHWNIDTSYELFVKGFKEIFGSDFRKAATRFYEITRQMIEEDRPDIIGHIDKIKMFNAKGKFFNEKEKWYLDQVNLTIETLQKHTSIVEVNTRGYYKYNQTELYPSEWIIAKMHKAGIGLMINSDAHHSSEIIKGMEFAAKRLKALGVEKLWALYDGKWKEYAFNEEGLFF